MRLLITGAAGAGTSTLAAAVAGRCRLVHLEADDYYWLPGDPPYTTKRDATERANSLLADMQHSPDIVVAGSVMGWGSTVEDAFDGIVFLYADTVLRLSRIEAREYQRFGVARPEFLQWAASYDLGTQPGRSLARHQAWLRQRQCKIIELDGGAKIFALVETILKAWPQLCTLPTE